MRRARLARHLTFTSLFIASGGALVFLVPADRLHDAASITTAYASLAFLTVALIIGPLNVLRQRPNPTNLYLRRDCTLPALPSSSVLRIRHCAMTGMVPPMKKEGGKSTIAANRNLTVINTKRLSPKATNMGL